MNLKCLFFAHYKKELVILMAKKLLFILHIVNNCNRIKAHEKNLVDYCQRIHHALHGNLCGYLFQLRE